MVRVACVVGLVVALAGPALTACGGSDRLSAQDYSAQLAALGKREDKAHADVDKLPKAKTGTAIRDGLTAFAADQERLASDIETLKPPKDAEQANALLARGARILTSEIREIVTELPATKSPRAALKRLEAIAGARGAAEEERARSQLKKLGYIKGN